MEIARMEPVYTIKFTSRGYALMRDDTVLAYCFTPDGAQIALERLMSKPPRAPDARASRPSTAARASNPARA
jgi:hypothetical protein